MVSRRLASSSLASPCSRPRPKLAAMQKDLFARYIPPKYQHNPFVEKAYFVVNSARAGLPSYVSSMYRKPLYLMQGLVGVVLLLCCVNIGGLMMARIAARQREFAVRSAVGASAYRLLRQYLVESFVIALAGAHWVLLRPGSEAIFCCTFSAIR